MPGISTIMQPLLARRYPPLSNCARPLVNTPQLNLVSSNNNNFSLESSDMGSDTILNSASKTNVFFYNSNDTTVDFCLLCRHRKLSELRTRSGIRQVECTGHLRQCNQPTICCDESTAYYVKKSTAALISEYSQTGCGNS